jgi:hypothetical protein
MRGRPFWLNAGFHPAGYGVLRLIDSGAPGQPGRTRTCRRQLKTDHRAATETQPASRFRSVIRFAAADQRPGKRHYKPIGWPAIPDAIPHPNGQSAHTDSHMPIASVGIPIRRSALMAGIQHYLVGSST